MLGSKQLNFLKKAALEGVALPFESWEENKGVIELRKIHATTKRGDPQRLESARKQMPYIQALWEKLSGGLTGMVVPKPMKTFMNGMFDRIKRDREYARLVYDVFPLIADRYGAGTQSNGKPRLSFVMMNRDPDCARLRR